MFNYQKKFFKIISASLTAVMLNVALLQTAVFANHHHHQPTRHYQPVTVRYGTISRAIISHPIINRTTITAITVPGRSGILQQSLVWQQSSVCWHWRTGSIGKV